MASAAAVAGPLFVTARSAEVVAFANDVAELLVALGSGVVEVTDAVLVSGAAPLAPVAIVRVKVATAPDDNVAIVQVALVALFEQRKGGPAGCVSDTKVVPAGNVSIIVTFEAVLGPLLDTPIV